jgi:hypothetical protein
VLARDGSEVRSDGKGPPKIMFAHICMLLRPFGLETLLPPVLAELRHVGRGLHFPCIRRDCIIVNVTFALVSDGDRWLSCVSHTTVLVVLAGCQCAGKSP